MLHELRNESRVILVDPKCAQLANLKGFDHLWPEVQIGKKQALSWSLVAANPADYFLRFDREGVDPYRKPFRVVVHLRHHQREGLEMLAGLVMAVKNCVIAIDELALFVPPGSAGVLPTNLTAVVLSGTHDGVRMAATVQRPTQIHLTVRGNASRILFYRVTERNEIDKVMTYLPADWTVNPASLPDYVCIDWRDGQTPFVDYSLVGKLKTLPGARAVLPAPPAALNTPETLPEAVNTPPAESSSSEK